MADLKALTRPLNVSEIDFRIQNINLGGYATILAYKDARVDMKRLDEAFTPMGWQRKHEVINGNLFCSIGCLFEDRWVWKEDVGTESYTEKEKGESSDSFKRAGFNWGIGRELYDYPLIQVKLKDEEFQKTNKNGKEVATATWKLKLKEWRWTICHEDGVLIYIKGSDEKGSERFLWFSVDGLKDSIDEIKQGIEDNDLSKSAECWFELSDGEKAALWVAPSKGGVFTTEERKLMQSAEFRQAYYGVENDAT